MLRPEEETEQKQSIQFLDSKNETNHMGHYKTIRDYILWRFYVN